MGFGFWISILALIISLYAAVSARRSAGAAERSAQAAEDAVSVKREHLREDWISKLQDALPNGDQVTGLLEDLPATLRGHWEQLLDSAARRNPRTPLMKFAQLQQKFGQEWQRAAIEGRKTE